MSAVNLYQEKIRLQQYVQVACKLRRTHVACVHHMVFPPRVAASIQNRRDYLQIAATFKICACQNEDSPLNTKREKAPLKLAYCFLLYLPSIRKAYEPDFSHSEHLRQHTILFPKAQNPKIGIFSLLSRGRLRAKYDKRQERISGPLVRTGRFNIGLRIP